MVTFLWLFGCGVSDVGPTSRLVGGRCSSNRDCDEVCVVAATLPGGYCSVGCAATADCPHGASCLPDGIAGAGVCVATCLTAADCLPYGADYACRRESTKSGDSAAGALVCNAR